MEIIYAKAGIFVMPSRSEGFPNALAEALCAGCCCVSFDFIAGPRDLIEDGVNGVLVEAENYVMLGEKLSELVINKKDRELFGINAELTKIKLENLKISEMYLNFIV